MTDDVSEGDFRRIPDGVRCPQCRYDLRGADPSGQCPECGLDMRRIIDPPLPTMRDTMQWWERARLIYNAILLVPGLLVAWPLQNSADLIAIGIIAITANAFYSLGPLMEGYAATFKRNLEPFRIPVFIAGTLSSLILVGLIGLSALLAGFD